MDRDKRISCSRVNASFHVSHTVCKVARKISNPFFRSLDDRLIEIFEQFSVCLGGYVGRLEYMMGHVAPEGYNLDQ